MARKDKPAAVKLQDLLDAAREEADAEGLAIVVSWADGYGGMQSVTLRPTDKMSISPPVSRPAAPRFALMTNGNMGKNPEYKYWTHQLDGKSATYSVGCKKTFMEAVELIMTGCPEARLVGIFDGILERSLADDIFNGIAGIPVRDVRPSHEKHFASEAAMRRARCGVV